MTGMNASTGKAMSRHDHIRQSMADILFTPIGSRVMRRDYGSELMNLIDQPLNPNTIMRCRAACVDALHRWEPRVTVKAVNFVVIDAGTVVEIEATDNDGAPLQVSLPVPGSGAIS